MRGTVLLAEVRVVVLVVRIWPQLCFAWKVVFLKEIAVVWCKSDRNSDLILGTAIMATESRKDSTLEHRSKRHLDDSDDDDSNDSGKPSKREILKRDMEGEKDQTSRDEDDLTITKDRSAPEGHGSTVASFYNNLENKGLQERKQSRIFFMRNSNNWIKSYIISHCLELIRDRQVDDYPIVALDLGCGKGGDLRKWQKGNIRHLICADIAETSVEQCRERYEVTRNKGFSAEFIVADCTKTRIKNLMKNPEKKIDLVSCQFAFHYCFESLQQAETMIRNISENLKRGGYFCATLPNAYEIMSRLKKSDGQSFGNEVYRIVFPDDRPETPPLFGDRYNFFLEGVVDCPEFLVHPGTFEKLANKWGLQLVWKRSFATVYNDALKDSEAQRLLSVMHALEVYPTREQATDTDGEYSHAQQYLNNSSGAPSIRTLSKSEWEAICLYQACVFRKTSDCKPV
ncbi:mRNA cap guanine-N7 methyltransferase isoform X2 [Macrobrachium rosenbergii]|uniref:mRNA cap guanine-N7 methyltransferase isoform X2 n=1 Tax=Macrobrachium rosenbergii TaxID=79674 RepID=UPI0034D7349A